jgi:hypothetical protein
MRTVEQLEKDLMPEATKADMSSELLATLGIAPVKGNLRRLYDFNFV